MSLAAPEGITVPTEMYLSHLLSIIGNKRTSGDEWGLNNRVKYLNTKEAVSLRVAPGPICRWDLDALMDEQPTRPVAVRASGRRPRRQRGTDRGGRWFGSSGTGFRGDV